MNLPKKGTNSTWPTSNFNFTPLLSSQPISESRIFELEDMQACLKRRNPLFWNLMLKFSPRKTLRTVYFCSKMCKKSLEEHDSILDWGNYHGDSLLKDDVCISQSSTAILKSKSTRALLLNDLWNESYSSAHRNTRLPTSLFQSRSIT